MSLPVVINKQPVSITPNNPALSVLDGKLNEEGKIDIDDAINLSLEEIDELKLSGVSSNITGGNIGDNGISVYKTKVGSVLQFKKFTGLTNSITVTEDTDIIKIGWDKANSTLNLVDNTSDISKPISTLTQTALDTKATITAGKIDDSVIPSNIPRKGVDNKILTSDLPDAVAPATITFYTAIAGTKPTGTGSSSVRYINRTDSEEFVWDAASSDYYSLGTPGNGGAAGTISITNNAGVTTTADSFTINKAFVGVSNVDDTSDAQKVANGPIKIALDNKVNTSGLVTTIRQSISSSNLGVGYDNSTGVITSLFTPSLKVVYDDAVTKSHTHTDPAALNQITQSKLINYDKIENKSDLIDFTPTSVVVIPNDRTTWLHDPLKPNVTIIGTANTSPTPLGLTHGSSGIVEFMMDGVGNRLITFPGISPKDYPEKISGIDQIQAYAKYTFTWFRDSTDLIWGSVFKGFGNANGKLATPASLTVTNVSGGIKADWGSVMDMTKFYLQRRTVYPDLTVSTWVYVWSPMNDNVNKANLTYTDTTTMSGSKYEYRVSALNGTNFKAQSDWRVSSQIIKS